MTQIQQSTETNQPFLYPHINSNPTIDVQDSPRKSYWRCSKQDFFPEPSFKDLSSYRTALSQICPRLKDRLLSRSTETHELVTLLRESENPMQKCLTWWDLMWMSFGSVVGSGIFVITGQEAREHAVAALWNSGVRGWIGYVVASVIWCSGTLGISLLHKNRVPKVWGVPLVPWLPSLSIAMNVFLLGSLDYVAFLRFIICSAVMILYYLMVGVHATYDVAHQNPKETEAEVGR